VRSWLAGSAAAGLSGERRAILAGVVLGDDQGLSNELRQRFRASGLYHLLAVSGQNVAFVACGALVLAWLLGVPRLVGEVGALAAVGAYVLAVGPQPSVVRAGIAGALGSLAWLAARPSDRWYFLLLGAIALLGWNPYLLLDAGFELSFAAVVAIFTLTPRLQRMLEGYPLPKGLADAIAVSGACGLATAPIAWFQFHAVPIVAVPANAMAAPAVLPLLVLALAAAAVSPLSPSAATALAWLNGWCAAYLAACARLIGGLPFAQVSSGRGAAALLAVALLGAAWLLRRRRLP
jgi:competence protein ComEC